MYSSDPRNNPNNAMRDMISSTMGESMKEAMKDAAQMYDNKNKLFYTLMEEFQKHKDDNDTKYKTILLDYMTRIVR